VKAVLENMTLLQRSLLISVLLHAGGLGLAVLPFYKFFPKKTLPTPRSMIVNFVKIGPQSSAPTVGPRAPLQTKQAIQERTKEDQKKREKREKGAVTVKKENSKGADNTLPQRNSEKKADASFSTKEKAAANAVSAEKNAKKVSQSDQATKPKMAKPVHSSQLKTPPSQKQTLTKSKINLSTDQVSSVGAFLSKSSDKTKNLGENAETYSEEFTGTEMDLLNKHMKQFWNMPSGHKEASNIVVEIELFIQKDGTIVKANVVDQSRFQRDAEFRLAAECALRAVLDRECSPLPLNPEKYDLWKHMIFVFDPREMSQ
jgi:hypothetical protein